MHILPRPQEHTAELAHYDTGAIADTITRPDGSKLYVGCVSQADSVLKYHQSDGSVRKELILTDELFEPESLETLRLVPYCSPHPKYGLRVKKSDRKGMTGSRIGANQSATHLMVDFVIDDKTLQRKTDSGELGGLSVGYTCWHQPVTGGVIFDALERCITDGGGVYGSKQRAEEVLHRLSAQFDSSETIFLQRGRRYYHLAGVKTPRAPDASPVLAPRLDSGDEVLQTFVPLPRRDNHTQETITMDLVSVRLDGRTVQVPEAAAFYIEQVEDTLGTLRADMEGMEEKVKDMGSPPPKMYDMAYTAKDGQEMKAKMSDAGKAMFEAMKSDMEAQISEMKGTKDAADEELAQLRQDAADRALSELKAFVAPVLGMRLDGMAQMTTVKDVQLAAIGVANGFTPEQLAPFAQRSDEAIAAQFEQVMLQAAQRSDNGDPIARQRAMVNGATPLAANPTSRADAGSVVNSFGSKMSDQGTGFPAMTKKPQAQEDMDGRKKKGFAIRMRA